MTYIMGRNFWRAGRLVLLSGLFTLLLIPFSGGGTVYAQGATLSLTVNIDGDQPTQYRVGDEILYVVDFSCSTTTAANCDTLEIVFPIDGDVSLVSAVASDGYSATQFGDDVVITTTPGNEFNDGDASQVLVRVQVRSDLPADGIVSARVDGTILIGNPPTDSASDTTPNIPIAAPTEQWSTNKTQSSPAGVGPAAGGQASYNVQVCSDAATGNISLVNPQLVDYLPTNFTALGGTVISTDGGTYDTANNRIVWDIGDEDNPPDTDPTRLDAVAFGQRCATKTVRLQYPNDPAFAEGTTHSNVAAAYNGPAPDTDPGNCNAPCIGRTVVNTTIAAPTPNGSSQKSGPQQIRIAPTGEGDFFLSFNTNNSNTPVSNYVLQDNLPLLAGDVNGSNHVLNILQITSGAWDDNTVTADIEYSTDGTAFTRLVTNYDGSGAITWNSPGDFPENVENLRWVFNTDVPPQFNWGTQARIRFSPRGDMLPADYDAGSGFRDYNNCAVSTFTGVGGVSQTRQACDFARVALTGTPNITSSKTSNPTTIDPGDNITFTLNLNVTKEGSAALIDPWIEDLLPPRVYVPGSPAATAAGIGGTPTFTTTFTNIAGTPPDAYLRIDDVTVDGEVRQRLRFYWDDTPLANSYNGGGTLIGAPASNTLSIPPTSGANRTVQIQFMAQAADNAIGGTSYTNLIRIVGNSPNPPFCQGSQPTGDSRIDNGNGNGNLSDIDGDGDTAEPACGSTGSYIVREAAEMRSEKWIRSLVPPTENIDPANQNLVPNVTCPAEGAPTPLFTNTTVDFTRTPCVAQGNPGEAFQYYHKVTNTGKTPVNNYYQYDILPYQNDVGVNESQQNEPRLTQFRVDMTGPLVLESPVPLTVEYNTTTNPCRSEMAIDPTGGWTGTGGTCDGAAGNTWYSEAVVNTAGNPEWSDIRSFRVYQPAVTLPAVQPTIDVTEQILIRVPMRIVDYDPINYNNFELPETGEIAWNTFAQVFNNAVSGRRLLPAQPRKVGIRVFGVHSLGNRVWRDDGAGGGIANNGIFDGAEAGIPGVTVELYRAQTNGTLIDADGNAGNGITPFRITTTLADSETGHYLFGNLPAGNYRVRIPSSQFATGAPLENLVSTTDERNNLVTGANETDRNLTRSRDWDNAQNSDNGEDPNTIDNYTGPATTDGVLSRVIQLSADSEPINEADVVRNASYDVTDENGVVTTVSTGANGRGQTFEADDYSDLTIDFGFYPPASVGNYVWEDGGFGGGLRNNGLVDGTENAAGIAGVDLWLFETDDAGNVLNYNLDGTTSQTADTRNNTTGALGADGIPDDVVAVTQTDANGYYMFDLLTPNRFYKIQIPPSAFAIDNANPANDGPLAAFVSSTGNGLDDGEDTDDNGIDPSPNAAAQRTNGVESIVFRLDTDNEPINEADTPANGDEGTPVVIDPITGVNKGTDGRRTDLNSSELTIDFGFYQPAVAVGNRVWLDYNNNGQLDTTGLVEPGINDVTMQLWRDVNNNGVLDIGTDILYATTQTANGPGGTTDAGYYLFDRLTEPVAGRPAGDALEPGRYLVRIDPAEWTDATGTLDGYVSSTGDNRTGAPPTSDVNDNDDDNTDGGLDQTNEAAYEANGIVSRPLYLFPAAEPAGETDKAANFNGNGNGADPRNGDAEIDDAFSDLTADFGLYEPMSIGNFIWYDTARTNGAVPGDGVYQPAEGELPIPGVLVEVYLDDGDGVPELGTQDLLVDIDGDGLLETNGDDSTAITDANGQWLVANIPPGNYWVHIPASQFVAGGPLFNYTNSDNDLVPPINETDRRGDGGTANNFDNQDHGQPPAAGLPNPTADGVTSTLIELRPNSERIDEDTDGDGTLDDAGTRLNGDPIRNDSSDLTIDFGFYRSVSIGNRVWLDANRDGLISTGEGPVTQFGTGVPTQITMFLFRDNDANGLPDGLGGGAELYNINGVPITRGDVIAVTTTGANGYYLFDAYDSNGDDINDSLLEPGNYIVGIDPAEFAPGGDLVAYISTITLNGTDDAVDNDDNGLDSRASAPFADINPNEIISNTVNLSLNGEASPANPPDDTDLDPTITDPNNREGFGVKDENANMTVDFGLFVPMAIGNRVWRDANNDQLQQDANGDGLPDDTNGDGIADEPGIANVTLTLLRDNDGDGTPEAVYGTATTDTNGYYLFDDLPEGLYIVRVNAANFLADRDAATPGDQPGALYDTANNGPLFSSEDTNPALLNDQGGDLNDNGIDNPNPATVGISSRVITLQLGTEPSPANPTDDLDVQAGFPAGVEGTNGELDSNVDLTVDFGFYSGLMSIGNRVFFDYDNNGVVDGNDVGVPGVTVRLYRYSDATGTTMVNNAGNPITGGSTNNPADAIATTTTATVNEAGHYIFDRLVPGFYRVVIVQENFRTGGVLRNYLSTQDRGDNPKDINGDSATAPNASNGEATGDPFENGTDNARPQDGGIVSPVISLIPGSEPQNEPYKIDTDTPADGIVDDGQPNIEDSNGDMTQDFGFYQPQSIGNRVWFDTNNNGVIDAGELGAANVTLTLYEDTNDNGVYDDGVDQIAQYFYDPDPTDGTPGAFQNATDTTDANGYYLFSNVPPGRYFPVVDASNFDPGNPLAGWMSTSPDVDDNTTDNDDNGRNPALPGGAVASNLVDLSLVGGAYQNQPLNEPDPSNNPQDGPSFIGGNGERDIRSNLTKDFGFVRMDLMSIGNRVWYDEDGNGLIDGDNTGAVTNGFGTDEWANAGLANVTLSLYRDEFTSGTGAATPDGVPDGAPIATATTDATGYYLFDGLVPGNYIVGIDAANFNTGNPLAGLVSTLTGATSTRPNTDDNNDNGIDTLAPQGILSATVNLTQAGEPDNEQDQDKQTGIGDGNNVAANDSDLTIDFGFHEPMSIGNQVFYDYNDNGILDGADTGVGPGVTVLLYRTDAAGAPLGGGSITNPADASATTTTDANGFYLFDRLPPGNYRVVIAAGNFSAAANPLFNTLNSTGIEPGAVDGNSNIDTDANAASGTSNENGIDPATTDGDGNGIPDAYETAGVASPVVVLASRNGTPEEPLGEVVGTNAAYGPNGRGNNGETDADSNLAVDFGFVPSTFYSIGNRVWIDDGADGAGGTTAANARNGVFNAGEIGIAGVTVNLYRDLNAGGLPNNPGAPFRSIITDGNGGYLFDALPAGTYAVALGPNNFAIGGALSGYNSTVPNVNPAAIPNTEAPNISDNNDNRDKPPATSQSDNTYGIISAPVQLGDGEPLSETSPNNVSGNPDPTGFAPDGTTAIVDANSDLTIDFGVFRSMSLGNRVWFDVNNNAQIDAGEAGVANVVVQLFRDANSDGIPDDLDGNGTNGDAGDIIATDTTDSNGYYLFNNLTPGQYLIGIPDGNFAGGGPLNGFTSSTGVTLSPTGTDLDDNGKDTPFNGAILSDTITLVRDGAPTGETQKSGQASDGPNFQGINNENDANSDLTWDFGFFSDPMSIGNRIWLDDGGGTAANASNGTFDAGESGIGSVTVDLFSAVDTNGDGTPDSPASTRLATTTTDANGYYLFQNLPPGPYIVKVRPENFNTGGPLSGFFSTTTGPNDKTTDNNDNGIDNASPGSNGVLSNIITLVKDGEPGGETSTDNTTGTPDPTGTKPDGSPIDDDDSNLTVDFGFVTSFDWGDAPDTYGTDSDPATTVNPAVDDSDQIGPSHRIITALRLGDAIDNENSGQPSVGADGDDLNGSGTDDEDGITFPAQIIPETTMTVEVSVFNNTGSNANLVAWFDWNGNGVFDEQYDSDGDGTPDTPEFVTVSVPSNSIQQTLLVDVPVPREADILTGGTTYARFRLTTDAISGAEPAGPKNDGEVEDYRITVNPPGIAFEKRALDTNGNPLNAVAAGQPVTYLVTLENSASGIDRNDQTFTDTLPTGETNGFDPASITWTCTGTNGATCDAANNTEANGAGNPVNTTVDLPAGGLLVFRITATARSTVNANITNTANLNPLGLTATEEIGVIFDPPNGQKTGVVNGQNVIRWTQVWFNTGARQRAIISDPLPAGQTFAGNLVCTAFDSDPANNGSNAAGGVGTETIRCEESGGVITWEGFIDTGNLNRLEIAFDVTVAGPGTYVNTATFTSAGTGGVTATASGTVNIDETGQQVEEAPEATAGGELLDPAIVKRGSPEFALPGEEVTWTVVVRNPNANTPLYGVSFSDNVPMQFEVLDVSADTGQLTVTGQNVTWEAAIMPPGQEVRVFIRTRLRTDVAIDGPILFNTAVLNTGEAATAEVRTPTILPETGQTPPWRAGLLALMGLSAAMLGAVGWRRARR